MYDSPLDERHCHCEIVRLKVKNFACVKPSLRAKPAPIRIADQHLASPALADHIGLPINTVLILEYWDAASSDIGPDTHGDRSRARHSAHAASTWSSAPSLAGSPFTSAVPSPILRQGDRNIPDTLLKHASPLSWEHIDCESAWGHSADNHGNALKFKSPVGPLCGAASQSPRRWRVRPKLPTP